MRFSILIPAYNAERTLQRAVESVLANGFDDFEVLICDDGSTDRTFQVATALSDSRIQVLRNKSNMGGIVTRNRLARESRGEYVIWLDADDEIDSRFLETSDCILRKRPEAGLIHFKWRSIHPDGSQRLMRHEVCELSSLKDIAELWFRKVGRFYLWSNCIRRDVMLKSLPLDVRQPLDDVFYALDVHLNAGTVIQPDTPPMYSYHRGSGYWDGGDRCSPVRLHMEMLMRRDEMAWNMLVLRRHGLLHMEGKVPSVCDIGRLRKRMQGLSRENERSSLLVEFDRWFESDGFPTNETLRLVEMGGGGDLSWFGKSESMEGDSNGLDHTVGKREQITE